MSFNVLKKTTTTTTNNGGSNNNNNNTTSKLSPLVTSQPKKLIIKNLKETPTSNSNQLYEVEAWNSLSNAIDSIHHKRSISLTLEELYRMVDNLCSTSKYASTLYSKLSDQIEKHIQEQLTSLLDQIANNPIISNDINSFLKLINDCWNDHSQDLILIMSIFLCLDRTFVMEKSQKSIWDLGLHFFRVNLLSHPELEKKLKSCLLTSIENERNGESINRDLLHNLIKMLLSLHLYDTFEKDVLKETTIYYNNESCKLITEYEVSEYLRHVQNRMNEERDRSFRYLDPTTKRHLIQIIERQMLDRHIEQIFSKGFNQLVQLNRVEDLTRFYSLYHHINTSINYFKKYWSQYIRETGVSMVADEEKESSLIQDIINLKDKLENILLVSFQKNDILQYTLKESFEYFINTKPYKSPELLAKYIDSKLRSHKGMNDDELESSLNKALSLFRYIQGKDVFEAFFKVDLSKRLLMEKSISIDAEKSMILKLRNECGTQFTSKLEGMFNDIDTSSELLSEFKETLPEEHRGVEMNVYVLATGNWPNINPIPTTLPKQFLEYQSLYGKFYSSKHPNKVLKWQNSLGSCVLKVNFLNGKKDIICSLLQGVILLLYNEQEEFTLQQIFEATSIEMDELRSTLLPLTNSKSKILIRKSKKPQNSNNSGSSSSSSKGTFERDDLFIFNREFTHKLMKIKVNAAQSRITVEENKKTNENIQQDRQYQIDAAIVRIMKTRKSLAHNLLMSELLDQLRFTPKPVDLKKRIESLIEREYLARDSSNPNIYNYVV